VIDQVAQSHRQHVRVERDAFAHGQRRSLVVDAKGEQLHSARL